jgi:hypothetical protein
LKRTFLEKGETVNDSSAFTGTAASWIENDSKLRTLVEASPNGAGSKEDKGRPRAGRKYTNAPKSQQLIHV